jgi:sugar lactone lactonase YvrE
MTTAAVRRTALSLALIAGMAGMGQQPRGSDLVWPKPPDEPRIRYLMTISGKADLSIETPWWKEVVNFIIGSDADEGRLVRPQGVFADRSGRIYVADPGARGVLRADVKDGFVSPIGVAVSNDGRCFVTDSELPGVVVFDEDGDYLTEFHEGLVRPTGIVIRGDSLYIVDTGTHQVVVCNLEGTILSRFGRRGTGQAEFNFPVYAAAGGADLFIVDAMNFRIQALNAQGGYVSSFGSQGTGAGSFAGPKGIATDSEGHLYVADGLFDAVQIFSRSGELLLVFGQTGTADGEFSLPTGMYIDHDDRIYVVDTLNRRIQVFQYLKRP